MPEHGYMDEIVARLIADSASGALEIRQAKKRWLFFFSEGSLVYTRSNLKSEQTESIRSKLGDLPTSELIRHQAVRRFRNAFRAASPTHSFHDGAHPPQVTPVHAVEALLEGIRLAYAEDILLRRIEPLLDAYPQVRSDIGGLGLPSPLDQYLQDLDGGRTGRDVLDFAPAPPGVVRSAMLVLWKMGEIELGEEVEAGAQIVGIGGASPARQSAAPPPQPAAPAPSSQQPPAEAEPAPAEAGPAAPQPQPAAPQPPSEPPPAAAAAPESDDLFGDGLDLGAIIGDALADGTSAPDPEPMEPTGGDDGHPLALRLGALADRIDSASNHFQVLDVAWQSEPDEIRKAYTALARELHPDRFHDADEELKEKATALFDRIRHAWEILSNPASRQEHIDVAIHGKKSAEDEAREQLEAYWAADDAFRRGLTLFKNGRLKAAHGQFRLAAEAIPDELEFQAYYGFTTYAINRKGNPGRADEGLAKLRDALERNKTQERQLDGGWVLLGRAFREKGELDHARRALIHALRLNPANSDATHEMKRLERDMGITRRGKKGGFLAGLFGRK